jgi:hypothetical protein
MYDSLSGFDILDITLQRDDYILWASFRRIYDTILAFAYEDITGQTFNGTGTLWDVDGKQYAAKT